MMTLNIHTLERFLGVFQIERFRSKFFFFFNFILLFFPLVYNEHNFRSVATSLTTNYRGLCRVGDMFFSSSPGPARPRMTSEFECVVLEPKSSRACYGSF